MTFHLWCQLGQFLSFFLNPGAQTELVNPMGH